MSAPTIAVPGAGRRWQLPPGCFFFFFVLTVPEFCFEVRPVNRTPCLRNKSKRPGTIKDHFT